ncbi:type II toxin-antitoxin system death-on-curing family toxin [Marivirga sp.]|uniref:type II toxin-antitoxin system death-on-curing family toxin n=1 Tax=Marivirga sp. TaxID=2018662 RepID=UPI0025FAC779|nr:type II toxin-antitoxin system death-on-curing family toxin [Marivirga sp.]
MISKKEAIEIHKTLVKEFGGSTGIRDLNLLDLAINRSIQTFGGKELYANPTEKSASILESIVKNHPFIDGNKRTGYVLARLYLMEENMDLNATEDEKYNFIISISEGKLNFDEILKWIESKSYFLDLS